VNAASFLASVIDIAIGIAGFAGIVAAVRQRRLDHWSKEQVLLLQILFTASAAAIVFGLLPPFLVEAGLRESVVWKVSSGVLTCWIVCAIGFRMHQSRRFRVPMPIPRHVSVWGTVSVAMQIFNIVHEGASWPYLFGVFGLLLNGFSVFLVLVMSPTETPASPDMTTRSDVSPP